MRKSINKPFVSDKSSKRAQEVRRILSEMSEYQREDLLNRLNLVDVAKPVHKTKKGVFKHTQQKVKIIHTCELCGGEQIEYAMIDRLAKGESDDAERVINNTRTHCLSCYENLFYLEQAELIHKLLEVVDKYDKKV